MKDLQADHFEKLIEWGLGCLKMLKGRGASRTKNMKPKLQSPNKALYRP